MTKDPAAAGEQSHPTPSMPRLRSRAPDFTLRDTHGAPVTLSSLQGRPVLLVFFPFAFSMVCHGELGEISARRDQFSTAGVQVLAISCDPTHALRAWDEHEGFGITLLSDFWPHGGTSRDYGVFNERAGHPERGSVLVDAGGVVCWTTRSAAGQARDMDDHLLAARALPAWGG